MDSTDNVQESSLMCIVYNVQLQVTEISSIILKIRMTPRLKLKIET